MEVTKVENNLLNIINEFSHDILKNTNDISGTCLNCTTSRLLGGGEEWGEGTYRLTVILMRHAPIKLNHSSWL